MTSSVTGATRAVRAILYVMGCLLPIHGSNSSTGSSPHRVDDELGAIVKERDDDLEEPTAAVETGLQLR